MMPDASLLERVLQTPGTEGTFAAELRPELESCGRLDATEAIRFFFDRGEGSFTLDFPNARPPFLGCVFVEGLAPERRVPTGWAGTKVSVLARGSVLAFDPVRGFWEEPLPRPGVLWDAGEEYLGRVGFLAVSERLDGTEMWPYGEELREAVAPATALHFAPFLETRDGLLKEPYVVWGVPLLDDGRVRPLDGEGSIPTRIHPDASEGVEGFAYDLAEDQRALLSCALFCVAATNAALCGFGEVLDEGGSKELRIGPLAEHLDAAGESPLERLGACGDLFGTPAW